VFGTFSVLAYVLSLRGAEFLLVDIKGMLKYEDKVDDEYFIVALLGKVKEENQDRCHLLPCTAVASSSIKVREWMKALLQIKKSHSQVDVPIFSQQHNIIISTHALDNMLIEVLEELYKDKHIERGNCGKLSIVQIIQAFVRHKSARAKYSRK
jgi:hypothetical protein